MITVKRLIILGVLLLCSCTTVKLDKNKLVDEFGSNSFTLNRTVYLISYFDCLPLMGVREKRTSEIVFLEEVSSEDIYNFESYKDVSAGDKNCTFSKDIRAYNMLESGTKIEVFSVKDVINASWWFLEIKGYAVRNSKKQLFRMELPFGEGKSIHQTLSKVFLISHDTEADD